MLSSQPRDLLLVASAAPSPGSPCTRRARPCTPRRRGGCPSARAPSSPLLSAPMLTTMSISVRALADRAPASSAFDSGAWAPSGNPTTQQTLTDEPRSSFLACRTLAGLTQTEKNPSRRASSQSRSMSARGGLGLEQGVVDQRVQLIGRDGRGAGGVRPSPAQQLPDLVGNPPDVLGRQVADPPCLVAHVPSSTSLISATRAWWRSAVQGKSTEDVDDGPGRPKSSGRRPASARSRRCARGCCAPACQCSTRLRAPRAPCWR